MPNEYWYLDCLAAAGSPVTLSQSLTTTVVETLKAADGLRRLQGQPDVGHALYEAVALFDVERRRLRREMEAYASQRLPGNK